MRIKRLLWVATVPAFLWSQQPANIAEIARKVAPTVVLVKGRSKAGEVVGSGFLVSSDGKIVTNVHVIRDLTTAGVQLASGEIFDSIRVLAFDERKDLAVIQIPGFDLPASDLGNSNELVVGIPVVIVGSPRGLQGTVTAGVLSAIRDEPTGAGFKMLQTDAAVNPGNSGGPLVNVKGEVIGVVTAKLHGSEGLNFGVPINYVRGLLNLSQSPITLTEFQKQLDSGGDAFKAAKTMPQFASRWKSVNSNTVRSLRFSEEYLYAEMLPPMPNGLAFQTFELKKQGNGYTGKYRSAFGCEFRDWTGQYQQKQCSFDFVAEINTLTPTRIEGRVNAPPKDAKFDCKKCVYSKPFTWADFVWIPE